LPVRVNEALGVCLALVGIHRCLGIFYCFQLQ
jgi:hypothetical protein